MKLWGWAHDNVSDSDIEGKNNFSFFYGLQLAIVVLSHLDNLSSSITEQSFVQ